MARALCWSIQFEGLDLHVLDIPSSSLMWPAGTKTTHGSDQNISGVVQTFTLFRPQSCGNRAHLLEFAFSYAFSSVLLWCVCVCLFFSHPFFVFCFVTRSRAEKKRALMGCHAVTRSCASVHLRVGWGAMTFLMLHEMKALRLRPRWANWDHHPSDGKFYQGQPSVASSISEEIRELWLGFVWKSQTWPKIHVWHIFGGINIPLFQTFGV